MQQRKTFPCHLATLRLYGPCGPASRQHQGFCVTRINNLFSGLTSHKECWKIIFLRALRLPFIQHFFIFFFLLTSPNLVHLALWVADSFILPLQHIFFLLNWPFFMFLLVSYLWASFSISTPIFLVLLLNSLSSFPFLSLRKNSLINREKTDDQVGLCWARN